MEKIYIAYCNKYWPNTNQDFLNSHLAIITKPNVAGFGCDFQPWSFDLEGSPVTLGLPNMPNYNLGALEGSPCDTLTTAYNVPTKSFELNISPNPANDLVEIRCSEKLNHIIIFDVFGRTVYDADVFSNEVSISTKSFASGIYVLHAETSNGDRRNVKFTIEK